jgi:hypothetical protein
MFSRICPRLAHRKLHVTAGFFVNVKLFAGLLYECAKLFQEAATGFPAPRK